MATNNQMIKGLYKRLVAGLTAAGNRSGSFIFRQKARFFGSHVHIGSRRWRLVRHPTDFSVINKRWEVEKQVTALPGFAGFKVQRIATGISRVSADPNQVENLMTELRRSNVVHHIYQAKDGRDEIAITNKILLTVRDGDTKTLEAICKRYKLLPTVKMGDAHVLEVTKESEVNPLKLANLLRRRGDVESCVPQTLLPVHPSNAVVAGLRDLDAFTADHPLLRDQWQLNTERVKASDDVLDLSAGLNVHKAWDLVHKQGKFEQSDVVIAIIDDGFDFHHPAFGNRPPNKNGFDYKQLDSEPDVGIKNHGICVASIAAANADKILGVAPGCSILPIRVDLSSALLPEVLLCALNLASTHADVVNCSFNDLPGEMDRLLLNKPLVDEIGKLVEKGGRTGNGLVIVFSAGNHGAPVSLEAEKNKNGVRLPNEITIPAGKRVHTLYTEIPNIVIVGAMSSLKRKSGYSNWGSNLTVTAPSDNGHPLAGSPGFGMKHHYKGLRVTAAEGGGGRGYADFGGTSAAAPAVTGVIALMRSVNPNLTPRDIIQILRRTANKEFPPDKLDVPGDPNLQGFNLDFDAPGPDGRSIIFGSGKVDAAEAVQEAINRLNAPAVVVVVAPGAGQPTN